MEYISQSESETFEIAHKIAKAAKGGDIFALIGDLGSGKTTFTKGFAKSLGVSEPITSPTFVLMKVYKINKSDLKEIIHVDCYRMASANDAETIGLSEYFNSPRSVLLIEWSEKIAEILPENTKKITFKYLGENSRKIITEAPPN